jgi:CDP-diacylglycerol--serine O-phosphatidyltransferase
LKVSGPLGLELDSLADMVTSGGTRICDVFMLSNSQHEISTHFMPYLDLLSRWVLVTVWLYSSIYRQTNSFIGLPTPANALFILSLP